MSWIVVLSAALFTKGEGEAGRVVDSAEIVILSVDPDCVLLEGYIMRN